MSERRTLDRHCDQLCRQVAVHGGDTDARGLGVGRTSVYECLNGTGRTAGQPAT